MDAKELDAKIKDANDKFIVSDDDVVKDNHSKEEGYNQPSPVRLPVDLYDLMRRQRLKESRTPRPIGASPRVKADIEFIAKKMGRAYNLANDTAKTLAANGDTARARMAQDQYMNDTFLPMIESLTHIVPAEELLNATSSLDELDKYVLTPGGSGVGYTRAFIQQLYSEGIGRTEPRTDGFVEDAVRRIKNMVASGQIRTAVGLATKTKTSIDKGEHSSSKDDYEILQKVAERGM